MAVATTALAGSASANHVKEVFGTYVAPFENPATLPNTSTAVQGIKGADLLGTYYVVGTNWPNGFIYEGPISSAATQPDNKVGTWTTFNVPSSWGVQDTSPYGVANLDGVNVAIVGSWNTGSVVNSFYYEGPITSTPDPSKFKSFTAHDPKTGDPADYTILHSVMGGLVVGNYDFTHKDGIASTAIIYNPATGTQTKIKYPKSQRAFTHTAYGIWWNGGTRYTITGGQSRDKTKLTSSVNNAPLGLGTIIDYDSSTGKFSHFRKYAYPKGNSKKASMTHFEGIWSNGDGLYRMPSMALEGASVVGGIATLHRKADGSFGAVKWRQLDVPNSQHVTTNNSIFGRASIGVSDVNGSIVPYGFVQQ